MVPVRRIDRMAEQGLGRLGREHPRPLLAWGTVLWPHAACFAVFFSLAIAGSTASASADDAWKVVVPVIELDQTDARLDSLRPVLAPVKRLRPNRSKAQHADPPRSNRTPVLPLSLPPVSRGARSPFQQVDDRPPVLAPVIKRPPVACVMIDMSEETSRTGIYWPTFSGRLLRTSSRKAGGDRYSSDRTPHEADQLAGRLAASLADSIVMLGSSSVGVAEVPSQVVDQTVAFSQLDQVHFAQQVASPPDSPGVTSPVETFRSIQELSVDIAPKQGALPDDRAAAQFALAGEQVQVMGFSREVPETNFEWAAPALCHRPLVFEDMNLERHGYHVKYLQPLASAAHFFARIPAVPYLAFSEKSRVCNYTLGHYRPGSRARYVWYYPQPSLKGLTMEGVVAAGLILAIP